MPARRGASGPALRRAASRTGKATIIQAEPLDRAEEAHRLHVDGRPWAHIAQAVGYVSAQVAQMAVTAYLQKAAVGPAPELRQAALRTELDRLDALHAAFWPHACAGEIPAALVVLKIIDRRTKLLRLDEASDSMGGAQRTILITGGPDMADELREAVLARERDNVHDGGDSSLRRQENTPTLTGS